MTQDELKKLRTHYHALLEIRNSMEDRVKQTINWLEAGVVDLCIIELQALDAQFPGFVHTTNFAKFQHRSGGDYEAACILAHLGAVIGKLKVAIEEDSKSPVTETREFKFVRHAALREILERDYVEIQKAYIANCWKSVIILAGSCLEAILIDLLLQHESRAEASPKAHKDKKGVVLPDIRSWGLVYLILVSADLGLINVGVDKHSHSLREYRDLIHPAVEERTKLKVDAEEARIALEVLNMVHRDLSK